MPITDEISALTDFPESTRAQRSMDLMAQLLVITVWASAMIFGLYIMIFYFIALLQGNTDQWNEVLPGLYDTSNEAATIGIGVHFAAGAIILILGSIQFVQKIRDLYPSLHRWLGRLYILASFSTAIGGLVFIFAKGTIGGIMMDIAFSGYGILTFVAAFATIYFARSGNMDQHRAWAIRLYALAIGSWLYRMDYGFWFLFTDGLGHTSTFNGPFDYFMNFFFYVPNLVIAEIFIGRMNMVKSDTAKWAATISLFLATSFLALATYFFTRELWGPAILEGF